MLKDWTLVRSLVSESAPAVRCPAIQLCKLAPPGAKPSAFASYSPVIRPINSFIKLRWNHGGRNVCSATNQRDVKTARSTLAVPGISDGEVRTVKIDGSG